MLTDIQCRNATCPLEKKQARFYDSGGLYLQVSPTGTKRWFLKYRIEKAEKQMALGSYPAVLLQPLVAGAAVPACCDSGELGIHHHPSLQPHSVVETASTLAVVATRSGIRYQSRSGSEYHLQPPGPTPR